MDTTVLDEQAPTRRNRRRRALLAILLSSSLATLGAGAMSLAVFSDSDAAGGSWTTGTIALGVNPSTIFTVAGILPGDSGNQTVVISNTGSGALRYAMSSTADNADGKGLRDQLNLTISSGACGSTTGTLYSGPVNGAFFGDNTQGAQGGDRPLAASTSESLCFAWDFPLSVNDNNLQAATTAATFTFDSEQTLHN